MANEEEVLGFEITDQDLEEEFNFDLRRPRISKNRATYGIWAENSDEDEEGARPAFGGGGGGRSGRRGADYTAPVGFVSAGIQQSGKKKEIENEEEQEEDGDPMAIPSNSRASRHVGSSSEEEEENSRASFGFRKKKAAKYEPPQQGMGQMAGMRTANRSNNSGLGKGLGDWEKHTRGIGAKLLMKMGYEAGKGLGKELQGRSTIVEAHLRKGRGAIGAYGSEGLRKKETKIDSEEEEEKEFKEQLHQWKKGGGAKTKKVKYVYKTADQVLEEGKWRKISNKPSGASAGVKVIDMTGREERVLSGYHAIASAKRRPDEDDVQVKDPTNSIFQAGSEKTENFAIPELIHNINLLMNTCEEDLISADRKLKFHKDRVSVLQTEEEKLSQLLEKEKEQIDTLQGVLELVEKVETLHEEKRLDLEMAMEMFHKMSNDYPDEYRLYELPFIATTIVAPLIKSELANWQVLDAPFKHKKTFAEWREILFLPMMNSGDNDSENDPFYSLVWEAWMPSVRSAITMWNTRNPDALIDFLKGWSDVIPSRILRNILDLIVLPKLQSEVSQWDPMTDAIPIHSWLLPWLEMLGKQLEIVYPTIKHKLSNALQKWHPSDKSARFILMPWKEVFDPASLQAFLVKNIVPKLEMTLHEFVINPANQDMSRWQWVMDWQDFLSSPSLVAILEKHFYPKWLQVLATWLDRYPDYTEVAKWFQGWKEEFGKVPHLLSHQQIKMYLNQALEMMNRAASGSGPPILPPQPPLGMPRGGFQNIGFINPNPPPPPPPPPMLQQAMSMPQVPETFRELVAKKCGERGILFMPIPGRSHDGKQIYRCGNTVIYIDRNTIFAQRSEMWIHVSLDNLLSTAL